MLKNLGGYAAFVADKYFQPSTRRGVDGSANIRIYDVDIDTVTANQVRFSTWLMVETGTRENIGLVPNQNASFKREQRT